MFLTMKALAYFPKFLLNPFVVLRKIKMRHEPKREHEIDYAVKEHLTCAITAAIKAKALTGPRKHGTAIDPIDRLAPG